MGILISLKLLFIISQVLLDFAGCQKLGVKREAKRKLHCSRRNVPRLSSMKVCCAWKKKWKIVSSRCSISLHEKKRSKVIQEKLCDHDLCQKVLFKHNWLMSPQRFSKVPKYENFSKAGDFYVRFACHIDENMKNM